jgi:hypothetical protein
VAIYSQSNPKVEMTNQGLKPRQWPTDTNPTVGFQTHAATLLEEQVKLTLLIEQFSRSPEELRLWLASNNSSHKEISLNSLGIYLG